MRKIIKYRLFHATTVDAVGKRVEAFIDIGWQPFGSPYTDNNCHCQAVVKYEDSLPNCATASHEIEDKDCDDSF